LRYWTTELTYFDTPPAKPEPRECHLAEAEDGTEDGEEAHSCATEEIEENDYQDRVYEANAK